MLLMQIFFKILCLRCLQGWVHLRKTLLSRSQKLECAPRAFRLPSLPVDHSKRFCLVLPDFCDLLLLLLDFCDFLLLLPDVCDSNSPWENFNKHIYEQKANEIRCPYAVFTFSGCAPAFRSKREAQGFC